MDKQLCIRIVLNIVKRFNFVLYNISQDLRGENGLRGPTGLHGAKGVNL